ncbi:MAG TPA: hypothetical protein VIJ66_04585 [Solirubrobacteraceae bacterium]
MATVRKPLGSRSARARRAAYAAPIAIALALGAGASLATGADLRAVDTAKLHYVGAVGEEVYETGGASGTLSGSMRVHMIFASTFSGSFAIYTSGGRIDGHGKARPHGEGVYQSFAGTLVVTGGTGRYRRAHGTAHLYGTFDRENYALTIQTAGTLRF